MLSGNRRVRVFDVEQGARLYLSNVAVVFGKVESIYLPGDSRSACGAAVLLHASAVLGAQFTAFEHNDGQRGGAICSDSDATLELVAVNMSGTLPTPPTTTATMATAPISTWADPCVARHGLICSGCS